MTPALLKVETPLMERYTTTCARCQAVRQFFGMAQEARQSAETMGWVFRASHDPVQERLKAALGYAAALRNPGVVAELAYCPYCQLVMQDVP